MKQKPFTTESEKPLTTNTGSPVGDNQHSQTVGSDGPVLLQDIHLLEKLAAFDRERIPERVVHARGAGAFGEFVSAGDFSDFTRAHFLGQKGRKTPVFVRFSTVVHGTGSPETLRDPRGFATKFYTEQGNYDIVGNNLPVFFIRDAMKFPDMVHSLKPSPITNKQDPNRFFDFFSHIPEAIHMITRLYSDFGIPANYREMNGSSVHSFKWINAENQVVYVKYTWKSRQGERNFTAAEAADQQSRDFQHATNDLYQHIESGNFPMWDLMVQLIHARDFESLDFSPLDPTKHWDENTFKPILLGTMTLNELPHNYFEAVEQSAFSPGTLVPGIEPSEDKLLQGRLFSYFDTQRYRVGSNFQQLPVNAPIVSVVTNNQDGAMSNRRAVSTVNYQPSRTENKPDQACYKLSKARYGDVELSQMKLSKTNDFQQAGEFYRQLDEAGKASLLHNLSGDLGAVNNPEIIETILSFCYQADEDYGKRLSEKLGKYIKNQKTVTFY